MPDKNKTNISGQNSSEEQNQLFRRIKDSDARAFEIVFRQFHSGIFNFLRYKMGSTELAEDILQETFVKFWENRENINENLSVKSYLFTIANNLALNYIRHKKIVVRFQRDQFLKDPQLNTNSPENIVVQKEFRKQLISGIENLPEKSRVVFMMSRFDHLSYKEIAERLSISVKTVESHIGKSLKRLREIVVKY